MLVTINNLPQVSVLKAKINESVGLPGGKQKLQYDVSIPGRTDIPVYMLAFHLGLHVEPVNLFISGCVFHPFCTLAHVAILQNYNQHLCRTCI